MYTPVPMRSLVVTEAMLPAFTQTSAMGVAGS